MSEDEAVRTLRNALLDGDFPLPDSYGHVRAYGHVKIRAMVSPIFVVVWDVPGYVWVPSGRPGDQQEVVYLVDVARIQLVDNQDTTLPVVILSLKQPDDYGEGLTKYIVNTIPIQIAHRSDVPAVLSALLTLCPNVQ
jgi:hypothetical protein